MEYPVLTASQLAAHLRSFRKAKGLSQAELGARLGVGQARIGKIERDPGQVSLEQLLEILALLGVKLVLIADVERVLNSVTASPLIGRQTSDIDDFRISIAGAQEKTALLRMGEKWYRPRNATPTTHILKLPLGVIGNFRGDFSHSVENEWLCSQFLQSLGLIVAGTTRSSRPGRVTGVNSRYASAGQLSSSACGKRSNPPPRSSKPLPTGYRAASPRWSSERL